MYTVGVNPVWAKDFGFGVLQLASKANERKVTLNG
jgi:hypothetical protein